jgi:hypothetical protein
MPGAYQSEDDCGVGLGTLTAGLCLMILWVSRQGAVDINWVALQAGHCCMASSSRKDEDDGHYRSAEDGTGDIALSSLFIDLPLIAFIGGFAT